MKKKLFMSLGLVGIIALSLSVGAYAATAFKLTVNGTATKLSVQTINKVNYVPLNDFAKLIGVDVKTDAKTNVITVVGKVPTLPKDGVYKAGALAFYDFTAEKTDLGWDLDAEVKNVTGKNGLTSVFTAVFYGADGKRIGTAMGSVNGLDVSATKTVQFITSDDLTDYKTVKFQIDM